jgi:hypothetical protein
LSRRGEPPWGYAALLECVVAGEQDEGQAMIRPKAGTVAVASAEIMLLLVAFALARAEGMLPELALDLTVYVFAITLTVFVVERALAWREERRWLSAKNWLYMILLETIDDLLKELLPATVAAEELETDGRLPSTRPASGSISAKPSPTAR